MSWAMISPRTRLPGGPGPDPARSRWPVVAAFAVVAAVTQLVWLNYAPVTSVAAAHFGVSATAIGWLANMFPLWYVLLAVPAGMVLDRCTFYKVFSTKDDCLVDLMRMVSDELAQQLTETVDPHADWRTQVAQAIETYFAHVAAQPAVYLCSIREFPSLGLIAEEVIRKSNDAFVDLIRDLSDNEEFRRSGLGPAPRHLALIISGGLNELTADLVESGGDLRLGTEIATATTTALLATNFASRGNPPGRKTR